VKQGQIESIVRAMEYENTMASRQERILDVVDTSAWRKTKSPQPAKLDPCDKSPTGAHYWLVVEDNSEQTCKYCGSHVVLKKAKAKLMKHEKGKNWGFTGHG